MAVALIASMASVLTAKVRTTRRVTVDPAVVAPSVGLDCDTIMMPPPDSLVVAGYDKTLRSRCESFFLSNRYASDTVLSVVMRIDYSDMTGRALHNRVDTLDCHLPPGDTRNYSIATWDRQASFYYHLSAPPRRTQGVPYRVHVTIHRAIVPRRR